VAVLSDTMIIIVTRSLTVITAPGSSRWIVPVPGCESAAAKVYLSVSLKRPALTCSSTSIIRGILIVLIVSMRRSAPMAISSPVCSDLT